MLAKDIKIKTLLRQRNFIEKQISMLPIIKDATPVYRYAGYVYPENILYFRCEGFNVTKLESDVVLAETSGMPVYLFTPKDTIVLNDDEMKQAEAYELLKEPGDEAIEQAAEAAAKEFVAKLLGDNPENPEEAEDLLRAMQGFV